MTPFFNQNIDLYLSCHEIAADDHDRLSCINVRTANNNARNAPSLLVGDCDTEKNGFFSCRAGHIQGSVGVRGWPNMMKNA